MLAKGADVGGCSEGNPPGPPGMFLRPPVVPCAICVATEEDARSTIRARDGWTEEVGVAAGASEEMSGGGASVKVGAGACRCW